MLAALESHGYKDNTIVLLWGELRSAVLAGRLCLYRATIIVLLDCCCSVKHRAGLLTDFHILSVRAAQVTMAGVSLHHDCNSFE